MSVSFADVRLKLAQAAAMCAVPFVAMASAVKQGREGVADARIASIAAVRVAALTDPQNASGPVAVAGTIGYYTAGIPGAFVAGFCTSLGCALLSRLAPEKTEKKDNSQ